MKEKCFKTLSEYRERLCRCHVWWKTVPDSGAGNRKSPFVDVERLNGGTAIWLVEADWNYCLIVM